MAKDNSAKESMDGVITDKRFSRLHSDPRFMRLPRNKFKVQIDSRFQRMFSDKKFSESSAVDKRGKPKKKKDKNALLEYYYRQHQEEAEEENVNKHTLKNNEDGPDENIGEMGRVSRANSFDKIQKKKNKRDEKHGNFHTICEDDNVVSDDCNLSNVTTISNSHLKKKKKNKKKECETVENYGSLGKTTDDCTYGGDDKIQDMQLMKMERKKGKKIQGIQLTKTIAKKENKTSDKLFDSNEVVHAETCAGKRGLGSTKKKKMKRNKSKLIDLDENLYTDEGATDERSVRSIKDETKDISSGSDENMFTEEAQENNRDVKLKNKKKKKNANNDLDDLDRKKYSFKNGLGIQGFEQFKGHHEQVKRQPEVSVALGGHKANSNLSEKLKCKGRLKGSGEDLNAIGASNFVKQSQTKAENEDGEKQIEKQSSMFESGKKENNTVGEFLRKHLEDEELSESTSSSGKDVDISESEESEASTSSDDDEDEDDYQIETDYPEEVLRILCY